MPLLRARGLPVLLYGLWESSALLAVDTETVLSTDRLLPTVNGVLYPFV